MIEGKDQHEIQGMTGSIAAAVKQELA